MHKRDGVEVDIFVPSMRPFRYGQLSGGAGPHPSWFVSGFVVVRGGGKDLMYMKSSGPLFEGDPSN